MSLETHNREHTPANESEQVGGEKMGRSLTPPSFSLTAGPAQLQTAGPPDPGRRERERSERERPEREEDGDFGVPYSTWAEAFAAETYLRTVLLPASAGMFGAEVMNLWWSFLDREPGDDMTPRMFHEGISTIAFAFKHCPEIAAEQNRLLGLVESNMASVPAIAPNEWVTVPLSTFVGNDPLNIDHVEFQNPFNIPGHVAGGTGGWDTGSDARWVSGNVKIFRMTDSSGATTKLFLVPDFRFRVVDAIDFIPGQPGTGLEQVLTIPLSRLEASGWAHDVPFEVHFSGPAQIKEVSGSLYPASPNPDEGTRWERQREPREPRDRPGTRSRLGERDDSRRRDF